MGLKIILADDHSVVRQGVALILKSYFKDIEVRNAQDFAEVLSVLKKFDAEIILLDINILGGNTTAMIDSIRKVNKKIYILMFSAYQESNYALRYIQAGANGYLSKEAPEEVIAEAINSLLTTGKYYSNTVKEKILENAFYNTPLNPLELLSEREIGVAELMVKGDGNLEIANKMNIQVTTVSTYRSRIFEKLKISNIVSLIEIFNVYRK